MEKVKVAIVMGSDSDLPIMLEGAKILKQLKISHQVRILSAHRTPAATKEFAQGARKNGIKVIIAGAGGAAHLAGVIASHTTLPVIGVPIETKSLKGLDSLLSTAQMPSGIPVASMAIGKAGAKNAALFAAEILSVKDAAVAKKLKTQRSKQARTVRLKDRKCRLKY